MSFAGASFSFGVVGLDDLPSSKTSSSPERVESRRILADPADGGGATVIKTKRTIYRYTIILVLKRSWMRLIKL